MKIFLIGMMGAGKTTLGKQLAEQMDYHFLDLDELIEKNEGKKVAEIFAEKGENTFRIIEQQTLQQLANKERVIIATGGGTPCFFDNMKWMKRQGFTIFIAQPLSLLASRLVLDKKQRPLLANKSYQTILSELDKLRDERMAFYQQAHGVFDAKTLRSVEDLKKMVEDLMKKQRPNKQA